MVHMCKRIKSPVFLHGLQILIFVVDSGVKGQKMSQNDKKSVALRIPGSIHHMIMIFGMHV